jgi:chemotaxis protein CheY-P-specific phosphatase CheC
VHVDADSLEQLNLRTRDGAEQAGRALAEAIDTETRIGATKITIASQGDLVAELITAGEECLEFELRGPLSGTAILAFDEPAQSLIDEAMSEDGGLEALAAELLDAFVDEWEAHVGGPLSVEEATYVPDPSTHDFAFETVTSETESAPLFQGRIDAVDGDGRIKLHLLPDAISLETLLSAEETSDDDDSGTGFGESDDDAAFGMGDGDSDDGGLFDDTSEETPPLPLDKLSVFSDLTRAGTHTAAKRVTMMTGIETDTEIAGINFTPIDDISADLGNQNYVGTTTEFEGTPSGHLVIMFPESGAKQIAEAMMPTDPDSDELTDLHKSAIEELGNIMTSGFIDGWANVLQTSVDHTPPEFSDDMELTLLEVVTEQLGPFQTHAYTIESRITTDSIELDCEIHALPNEAQLSAALDDLLVARADQVDADPEDVF